MDDLSFGNVWGDDSSPKPLPASLLSKPIDSAVGQSPMDDFDDFAEFDQPAASTSLTHTAGYGDDDFGDFGDFDSVPVQDANLGAFEDGEDAFGGHAGITNVPFQLPAKPPKDWSPIELQPLPSLNDLKEEMDDLLDPLWSDVLVKDAFTFEPIRQVEGPGQILVTPESRSLFHVLLESPLPPARPPNWTRSRIRRQHLITLGIPINLDEVLPHANGKPLPALQITTRPSSAPPTPRALPSTIASSSASGSVTRSSTPKPSAFAARPTIERGASSGLGPMPVLDQTKVDEVLNLDADTLPLLPLPVLNAHLDGLRSLTATASSVLTHLLQQREALQQESENYNAAIAALISKETQKLKSGGARSKTPVKRGSVY